MNLAELRENDCHKPCETGCSLGCVRMVSHTLGEPLKTMGASLRLVIGVRKTPVLRKTPAGARRLTYRATLGQVEGDQRHRDG